MSLNITKMGHPLGDSGVDSLDDSGVESQRRRGGGREVLAVISKFVFNTFDTGLDHHK